MQTSILQNSMAIWIDQLANMRVLAEALPDLNTFPMLGEPLHGTWKPAMICPIVVGAIGYLLMQYGMKSKKVLGLGIAACVLAGGLAISFVDASFENYLVMAFCSIATAGGVSFLVAKEPVYAALGFATAVLSTCGVLFMQSALFIAAATMIVYAGATIIIFLFVLMFAQQTTLRNYDVQMSNPWLAATISALLLITITLCVKDDNSIGFVRSDITRPMSAARLPKELENEATAKLAVPADQVAVPKLTSGLGRALYTDYLLAVELAGTVLLVATIGAIALAQRTTEAS